MREGNELYEHDGTEVGEVIVRSVKSGYADVNAPGEQAARLPDGWLYTGDLATWDADEYVTIVGTCARMSNVASWSTVVVS